MWRSNQLSYRTVGIARATPRVCIINREGRYRKRGDDTAVRLVPELLDGASPERRCSSRTFRYGYLVTT